MRKEKRHLHFTLRGVICTGLALLRLVTALSVHREIMDITAAAQSAIGTMKLECVSFNKLTAADRTKSLFRLSDMMRNLSDDLARQPQLASDDYLEQYVDSLRLSGVALLVSSRFNVSLSAAGVYSVVISILSIGHLSPVIRVMHGRGVLLQREGKFFSIIPFLNKPVEPGRVPLGALKLFLTSLTSVYVSRIINT